MRLRNILPTLVLPVLLGAGCYADAGYGYSATVYSDPPPPPAYYYDPGPRAGYAWVDGRWYWGSNQWRWKPGYYLAERPNHAYVQGGWVGHTYRPGYWRPNAGGGTVVRDHRDNTVVVPGRPSQAETVYRNNVNTPPPKPAPRPAEKDGNVRDHR